MPNGIIPHCPCCESVNLDVTMTDTAFVNRGTVRLGLVCLHCGATWQARYSLKAIYHVERQGQAYPALGKGAYAD